MGELKNGGARKKERKIQIGLMQFGNLKLLFTQVISHLKKSNFQPSYHFIFSNTHLLIF